MICLVKYFNGNELEVLNGLAIDNQITYTNEDGDKTTVIYNRDIISIYRRGIINYDASFKSGEKTSFTIDIKLNGMQNVINQEVFTKSIEITANKITLLYTLDGEEIKNYWEIEHE